MGQPAIDTDLDPITFEVLRSSLEHAADRMSTVLQRTSFSPILYDMVDFSNAVFDPDGQLIGQTANVPVHLAAMHFSVEACFEEFSRERMVDGDVYVLNDPYQGGTHIPDITFTRPIYDDTETLLGFGVSRGHWMDLGGGAPGGESWGTHLVEEGLRIPPMRIVEEGEPREEIIRLLKKNTRTPQYIEGDFQAHLAALTAADEELRRLGTKYGPDQVRQGMTDILDYTEQRTRAAIHDIPDGEHHATDYVDCDGTSDESIHLEVTLTVEGDRIAVDFAGTDPEARGAINSPKANTYSAVYYALKFFTDPEAPPNAGMYRPIDIHLPERTWVNPKWPRPTYGCTILAAPKICAVIWQALAEAIPDQITAPTYTDCNSVVFQIEDPNTGDVHVTGDLPPGGWGGTPYNDGMDATFDPLGNCMDLPAERAERLFPVMVAEHEFIPNSGGPGTYRGGLGMRRTFQFFGHTRLSFETSRTKAGTPGVNGGEPGAPGLALRRTTDGREEVVGGWDADGDWHICIKSHVIHDPGEAFTIETQGGGGWGDPADREPEQVLADVRDDKITVDHAREIYGVVIDPETNEVDVDRTDNLRSQALDGVQGD